MDTSDTTESTAEKRRGPRFEAEQAVTVTNLDDRSQFPGRLANFSTHGCRVLMDRQMPAGSVVKVEWGSTMLLGEIVYCRREAAGFSLGMELENALYDTKAFNRSAGSRKFPE